MTLPNNTEIQSWQLYTLRNQRKTASNVQPSLLPANTQIELLSALDTVQRCLIVGSSDSGKTTVLQWLVQRRAQSSKVIVIDPHAYPDKWQQCTVIGTGRNYNDIGLALESLVRLMTKRYTEIGKGIVAEQAHPRITILIDEWRAIVYNVKGAGEAIKSLLTESRKAAFSVFIATHSDRAKPLGLDGEYDLKDGFAVVRLTIANGQRQATIDTGGGEAIAALPGPYPTQQSGVSNYDEVIDLAVESTPMEQKVLDLFDQGEKVSVIAQMIYGSKGGNQNQKIKGILEKYERV